MKKSSRLRAKINRSTGSFGRFLRVLMLGMAVLVFAGVSFLVLNVQTRLEVRTRRGREGGIEVQELQYREVEGSLCV